MTFLLHRETVGARKRLPFERPHETFNHFFDRERLPHAPCIKEHTECGMNSGTHDHVFIGRPRHAQKVLVHILPVAVEKIIEGGGIQSLLQKSRADKLAIKRARFEEDPLAISASLVHDHLRRDME